MGNNDKKNIFGDESERFNHITSDPNWKRHGFPSRESCINYVKDFTAKWMGSAKHGKNKP